MDIKDICLRTEEIARVAGEFINTESVRFDAGMTESKGQNDFVTYVDREAERILVEGLGKLLPEAGFIVEENSSEKAGERYCWVVDPLDGTTNFIYGLHPCAVSIALMEYGEVIAGIVHESAGLETFTAWKGGGAWCNGKKIKVSERGHPSESLAATGFPYRDFSRLPSYLECLEWMLRNTRGVRRMGSASIDLAYVACGRYDLFFEYGLKPWDVAAGILLVNEAGGTVSDFSGSKGKITDREIIAANSLVHPEILEIISKFMAK